MGNMLVGNLGIVYGAGQTVGVSVDGARKAALFTLDGYRVGELRPSGRGKTSLSSRNASFCQMTCFYPFSPTN